MMKMYWSCLGALCLVVPTLACGGNDDYVAHEWGTFTTVQGADGTQVRWNPFLRTDLPDFVYNRNQAASFGWKLSDYLTKGDSPTIVRMETPVIYFYSKQPRTVDVSVKFPQGLITEWYPQAKNLGPALPQAGKNRSDAAQSFIEWNQVKILAPAAESASAAAVPKREKHNHYYEARETDANFITVENHRGATETERFLFYRGTGNFKAPLTLRYTDSDALLNLSTADPDPLSDLYVLTIHKGQARYTHVEKLAAGADREVSLLGSLAPLSDVRSALMTAVSRDLAKHGLYDREATAMVNTWKDQWFTEEGTRVIYILPRAWTDRVLPLALTPAPRDAQRVMVGRAEFIAPSTQQQLRSEIVRYSQGDSIQQQAAVRSVRELNLGRFLEPAVRMVTSAGFEKEMTGAAWRLAQLASNGDIKAPAVEKIQAAATSSAAVALSR